MKGIGGHTRPNRGHSVEWHTPPDVLAACGPFDDDPALPGRADGLTREWHGFVWMNPPYPPWDWLRRLAKHGQGIAMIFARTETRGFFEHVWSRADAILFLKGRPHYYRNGKRAKGNSGGPVALVAYGLDAVSRLEGCGLPGTLVRGWRIVHRTELF